MTPSLAAFLLLTPHAAPALDAGIDTTALLAAVERLEYDFSTGESGVLAAPNRAHGLRTRIEEGRTVVRPRGDLDDASAGWSLALETLAIGRADQRRRLGEPRAHALGARAELRHDGLVEWFVNDVRGVEQGWTVTELPAGAEGDALTLELGLAGLEPRLSADRRTALLHDESGAVRLRYEGLVAWDADERPLPARMERTASGLAIRVEVRGARLPITIDPLLTNPDWSSEGGQVSAQFGAAVDSAGDVNGDGFDDVLVGATRFDDGFDDEGRVFLFLGSAGGLGAVPAWSYSGGQTMANLGISVAGAGDVNADGYDDIVMGAAEFDAPEAGEGRAFLFLGSPSGPSLAPDWTGESDLPIAAFGWRVAGAGDVNADGFDDVLVSAPYVANPVGDEGRAYLFLGSASGLETVAAWTMEGNQTACVFGRDLDGAGDVNGDGYDDVIIGANLYDSGLPDLGRAFVFLGSPAGLELTPVWTADGVEQNGRYGQAVAGAGDVNADGYDDVIVGAPLEDDGLVNQGRAYLYLGSASGPESAPAWTSVGDEALATYAFDLDGAGDVNADGYADFLVGEPAADGALGDEGRAHLFLGSPVGPVPALSCSFLSGQQTARLGSAVASAGDVDGDGFDDVLAAAPLWDGGQADEGAVFLFLGELSDCNANGVADATDIAMGTSPDCNANQVPDECDIASGASADADGSGVPDECECTYASYCPTAPNSVDPTGALIGFSGTASVAANDLVLSAAPLPPNQSAVFYFGPDAIQLPFGDGWRCVAGPRVFRLPVVGTGAGTASQALDLTSSPGANIGATETWHFQCWYRDPAAGGATFNLSDALEVRFCL